MGYHQALQVIELLRVGVVSDHSSYFNIRSTCAKIRSGRINGTRHLKQN